MRWVAALEVISMLRQRRFSGLRVTLALYLLMPAALAVLCWFAPLKAFPLPVQALLTLAIVVPIGPLIYRVFFQPLASASILVLLIAAVAVHLAMVGLGLLAFGAEGMRTGSFASGRLQIGWLDMSAEALWVIAASMALIVLLYLFFEHSMLGKALRATAANRVGARIVGIRTRLSGTICLGACGCDRHAVGNSRLAVHDDLLQLGCCSLRSRVLSVQSWAAW